MKYRDLPTLTFKKYTSRRKRKNVSLLIRHIFEDVGPEVKEACDKAYLDQFVFGDGFVKIAWDNDNARIKVEHVPHPPN